VPAARTTAVAANAIPRDTSPSRIAGVANAGTR
jgi:hypothetical protein